MDTFMPAEVGTTISIDHLPGGSFAAGKVSSVELVLNEGKAIMWVNLVDVNA